MDIHNSVNPIRNGNRSKLVKDFLVKHNLNELDFPSTGKFATDMMLRVAAYREKQEAMQVAIDILRSQDSRALSLFNMLTEINLMLAKYESEKDVKQLVRDFNYQKWMQLKFQIIKHYEDMKYDYEKTKLEKHMRDVGKEREDTLFVVDA